MQSYKTGVIAWANEQAVFIRSGLVCPALNVLRMRLKTRVRANGANLKIEWLRCLHPQSNGSIGRVVAGELKRNIKDRRTTIMRRLNKTPGLKPELKP